MGEKLAATFWRALFGAVGAVGAGAMWIEYLGLKGGWLLAASALLSALVVTALDFLLEWISSELSNREVQRIFAELNEERAAEAPAPEQVQGEPKEKYKWN